MMKIEPFDFDVQCEGCKKEFTISTKDIGTTVHCPHCDAEIALNDDGFSEGVTDIEEKLSAMFD